FFPTRLSSDLGPWLLSNPRDGSRRRRTSTCSAASLLSFLHVEHGSDLDRVPRPRLRERDRRVLVRQLEDGEAAYRFLRLDEWTVEDAHLVAALPDRGRRA